MLNDEILAAHLGIWHLDRFYYLMPTFNQDPKWNKFSLGRLHLEELIRWSLKIELALLISRLGQKIIRIFGVIVIWLYITYQDKFLEGIIYYARELIFEFIKANPYLKTKVIKVSNLVRKRNIL